LAHCEHELTERYRSNLQALDRQQPRLAQHVEATPIPATVTPATGRDGSATFRLHDGTGNAYWFGRSSMPTVSAAALLADCADTGESIFLPGVLCGFEPLALADKLSPHCAVFVWQDDTLLVKLAMHLYDYAPLLESGRLVFVLAGDSADRSSCQPPDALCEFFERNNGYEFPTRMVRAPQVSPAELSRIQGRIETAGRAVSQAHHEAVTQLVQRIHSRLPVTRQTGPFKCLPAEPRVAVVTVDARAETIRSVWMIGRSLEALGWPHRLCAPDAPGLCHVAARLHAIEAVEADVVLFVNCAPGQLGAMLPRQLPLVAWYLPETAADAGFAAVGDAPFLACVSTPWLGESALRAGLDPNSVKLVEIGTRTELFGQTPNDAPKRSIPACDVGVVVELPEDDPEATNVTLPSYAMLYDALRDHTRRHIEEYTDALAPKFLEQAQRQTRVEIEDATLREHFVGLIRSRIAPVAFARRVMSTLIKRGRTVRVWGRCGQAFDDLGRFDCRPLPTAEGLRDLYRTCRVVLIPVPMSAATQLLLDGLLVGANMVCKEPQQGLDAAHPQLAPVLRSVHWFKSAAQVATLIDRIIETPCEFSMTHVGPGGQRYIPPRSPRKRWEVMISDEHSVQSRLRQIMALVRDHVTAERFSCGKVSGRSSTARS